MVQYKWFEKHTMHKSLLLLLIVFLTFPAFAQNEDAFKVLKNCRKKYSLIEDLNFSYVYRLQKMDTHGVWSVPEEESGRCNLNHKDGKWTLESDRNQSQTGYKRFLYAMQQIDSALISGNYRLFYACGKTPYYMVELKTGANNPPRTYPKSGSINLYIDTATFLIKTVQMPRMTDNSSAELITFAMDSISYQTRAEKVFQLNRNMLHPGDQAPDFILANTDGETVKLSDYKGKLILLDFWYCACKPCIKASFALDKLQKEYRERGLVVLGMNTMDKAGKIKRHQKKYEMKYMSVLCSREVRNAYKVNSYPSIYLIDENGKILFSTSGYSSQLYLELKMAILDALANR
jgi:peroxiredoxin